LSEVLQAISHTCSNDIWHAMSLFMSSTKVTISVRVDFVYTKLTLYNTQNLVTKTHKPHQPKTQMKTTQVWVHLFVF